MKTLLASTDISSATVWTKSRRSGAAGHCVEVAQIGDSVALRHSKAPHQGAFLFTPTEMTAFIQGAKDGDFDYLL